MHLCKFCNLWRHTNRNRFPCSYFLPSGLIPVALSNNAGLLRKFSTPSRLLTETESQEYEEDRRRKQESTRRAVRYTMAMLAGSFSCLTAWIVYEYGGPLKDPDGNLIVDEFSELNLVLQYIRRAIREAIIFKQMIKDPSRENLLPDPVKYPYYQPPYTLVFALKNVLVYPEWTFKTGWRFKKRPAVNYMLTQLSGIYEIVVFAEDSGLTAASIVEGLDKENKLIHHRLFKDSTRYVNNKHIKDLNCLNRDLRKVIIVDWDDESACLNSRNQFHMDKWFGNEDDRALLDLTMFLQEIARSGVEDLRDVMDYYRNFDDPLGEFRENFRKIQENEENSKKIRHEQEENRGVFLKNKYASKLWNR